MPLRTATSAFPSPLKSPTRNRVGVVTVPVVVAVWKLSLQLLKVCFKVLLAVNALLANAQQVQVGAVYNLYIHKYWGSVCGKGINCHINYKNA